MKVGDVLKLKVRKEYSYYAYEHCGYTYWKVLGVTNGMFSACDCRDSNLRSFTTKYYDIEIMNRKVHILPDELFEVSI